MPKVSIIIAARDSGKYIERAIRSCLNQRFDDFEVIVVNDSSHDDTKQIASLFDVRLINIARKESGCGTPSNVGIRASKSQYVVRVDSDDFISPDLLYIEHLFLEQNKDMDAVACDYHVIDEDENILYRGDSQSDPIACGIMFRKDRFIDVGLYDESLQVDEEKDLMSRFIVNHYVYHIPLPLYRYYKHEGSLSWQ